jgi:hypothetical protein
VVELHPPKEQLPSTRPEGPAPLDPRSAEDAGTKLAYARWLAERVLQGIDTESETVRNMLYRLAQANLALGEVVSELLRDRTPN